MTAHPQDRRKKINSFLSTATVDPKIVEMIQGLLAATKEAQEEPNVGDYPSDGSDFYGDTVEAEFKGRGELADVIESIILDAVQPAQSRDQR
ncbi:hypothetical protein [Streptomyces sp. NPDC054865]